MTETLKKQDIDIQNNMQDWIKNQVEKTYQETDSGLKDLKDKITNDTLENELTMEHVKGVLKNALDKFSQGKSFKDVYGGTTIAWPEGMWAGLVLNVQIALKKLGKDVGVIDWRYGKRTKDAVIAFQKENSLEGDWRAGKLTLTKMLEQLGEPQKAKEEAKKDEETKKPDEETKKPDEEKKKTEQETIILDETTETKIDHLSKIKENFILEPATYINIQSVEQKDQTFVMKAKLYDKDVSIVFDKDYKNPVLEIGKDIFNLNVLTIKEGKAELLIKEILITNKPTLQQNQEAEKAVENLYKNAEFVLEGFIPESKKIEAIFNTTNLIDNFSLWLQKDTSGKETKVDVAWVNKEKINLKDDFTAANNNSINLHFSKLEGQSIDFILTIKKTDSPDRKKFTITSVVNLPGDSWAEFLEQKNIESKILDLQLPIGWTKATDKPITFDIQNPTTPWQETDKIHLHIVNNNQKEQIDFDKDGELLQNQELTFDKKTHLVSKENNKIVFTEKIIQNQELKTLVDKINFEGDVSAQYKQNLLKKLENGETPEFIKTIWEYKFLAKSWSYDWNGSYSIIFSTENWWWIKLKELENLQREKLNLKFSIATPAWIDKRNKEQLINKFQLNIVV